MASIQDIRAQYPQYNDMSDGQLADAMYARHYSDMPREQFNQKIGLNTAQTPLVEDFPTQANEMVKGATFGLNDEATAGLVALRDAYDRGSLGNIGNTYDQALDITRGAEKQYETENPLTSFALQMGGGLTTGLAGSATKTGSALINSLRSGNLTARMAKNAALGATSGGLYGFGTGEGEDSRLSGAGEGALLGGAVGGASPLVASGASKLANNKTLQKYANAIAENEYEGTSQAGLFNSKDIAANSLTKPEELAVNQLGNALSRDSINLADTPLHKNLLQTNGAGVSGRAEAIASRDNQASDLLAKYATNRKLSLGDEIQKTLGSKFEETNYPEMLDSLKKQAYADARPAYEKAYSAVTSVDDPVINDLLDNVVKAGDWGTLTAEARKIAAYDGRSLGNIDATGMLRSFSTQDLDYMTRALRNLGQSTEGAGAMGGRTPLGAMRGNVAGAIRERLREINPAFGDAVSKYADDVTIYKSAQNGKMANVFGANWKDAVSEYNALPNETAKKAWRLGQAEKLQNMIATNPSAALTRFNSQQFRNAMSNFYTPQEFEAVTKKLSDRLNESLGLQKILGNSRTALRLSQQQSDAEMGANKGADLLEGMARNGIKRTALDQTISAVKNSFVNTKNQQGADMLAVKQLLATPFNRAGWETGGGQQANILKQLMQNAGR